MPQEDKVVMAKLFHGSEAKNLNNNFTMESKEFF
jgi:hypothetical protein